MLDFIIWWWSGLSIAMRCILWHRKWNNGYKSWELSNGNERDIPYVFVWMICVLGTATFDFLQGIWFRLLMWNGWIYPHDPGVLHTLVTAPVPWLILVGIQYTPITDDVKWHRHETASWLRQCYNELNSSFFADINRFAPHHSCPKSIRGCLGEDMDEYSYTTFGVDIITYPWHRRWFDLPVVV